MSCYLSEDDKLVRAFQGKLASQWTLMITHEGNPPNWVYTPRDAQLTQRPQYKGMNVMVVTGNKQRSTS